MTERKARFDLGAARRAFADTIIKSRLVPDSAELVMREGAVPEATVIHCTWPLEEKEPFVTRRSREITIQISAAAIGAFREGSSRERGDMLTQFTRVFQTRLVEGGYREGDSTSPPFVVHVDQHSLQP